MAILSNSAGAQVAADNAEDFETEIHEATSFSLESVDFTTTGSLAVLDGRYAYGTFSPDTQAGSGPSVFWLGTPYQVTSTGEVGTIQVSAPTGQAFRVVSVDVWTSADGGDSYAAGEVTFTGVRPDDTTVVETVVVSPSGNSGADYDTVVFSQLAGLLIDELRVTLGNRTSDSVTPLNNVSLDNLALELRPLDPCASGPCQNDGTCEGYEGEPLCTCTNGYDGDACELDVDECVFDPCVNGGTCSNEPGTYSCSCPDGFTGPRCETTVIPEGGGGSCAVASPGRRAPSTAWLALVAVAGVGARRRRRGRDRR